MSQPAAGAVVDRVRAQARAADDGARRLAPVLWQAARDLLVDSGPQWAAAVSYYALLSALPLLLLAGAIAAFFVDPQAAADRLTAFLGEFAPAQEGRVQEMVDQAIAARGRVGVLSFFALLWTGTRVFDTLIRALNIAYDTEESFSFFGRLLIEAVMLLTLGAVFLLALASGFLVRFAWEALRILPAGRGPAFAAIQGGVRALLVLAAFFLLYRFVPRGRHPWPPALVGAAVAALLFVLARPLFVSYLERFGQYNLIYGSLATAVVLLVWVWIVALITLYGGEVAAHVQAMLVEGRDAAEVGRRHAERAGGARRDG